MSEQVFAELTDITFPIAWKDITGVAVGDGVNVGVTVGLDVNVGVTDAVLVGVTVVVGVILGVFVGVGVLVSVGVGVIPITNPSSQLWVSIILITIFCVSYGGGTSNVYGNTETVDT